MKEIEANNNHFDDPFLKDLFAQYEPENPSVDLKKQTMANLLHQWSLKPEISNNENRYEPVIWAVSSVLAIVGISFLIDYYSLMPKVNWHALMDDLKFINNIESTLQIIYKAIITLPSIIIMTIIGGSVLLTLDQLVKKRFKINRNQYFIL